MSSRRGCGRMGPRCSGFARTWKAKRRGLWRSIWFRWGCIQRSRSWPAVKVSAEMGRGDKVYAYLHKLRTAVRSVSESTAEIIEGWFCGEATSEVGGADCCLGAIEEVALKNGGGWHGQGWIGKGKWVVCRAKVDSSGQCGSCREQLATVDIDRAETETFSESVAAMAMEREVRSNFREFQDWLDKHADYEAIVDGANIGLYQQNFASGCPT
ncbi:hypothetical protein VitviT2T_024865 [Vitis vinifera]|uniref:ribonuclease P n=2 Tax=Vitis vinifera TaxID=29760 RepID=A0ABY9DH32_VITVI|nr:hypothetical protein VitviT2T_024865 [Vitis vinifera]